MANVVTYIHHNCFLLEFAGSSYLFDVPGPGHLPEDARRVLLEKVRGRDLLVFISHSHEDHFDPGLPRLLSGVASLGFVVSDDVEDMFPDSVPPGSLVVEPDESYQWRGLNIETLMSNDLGVAFVIRDGGRTVYYGGDLADWSWDSLGEKARRMTGEFFRQAVQQVAGQDVQVAFSNVDDRLANLAGGPEFVRLVRPRVFVPMHTFGKAAPLQQLLQELGPCPSEIFVYQRPGDSMVVSLEQDRQEEM